jgi:hypothetical protein
MSTDVKRALLVAGCLFAPTLVYAQTPDLSPEELRRKMSEAMPAGAQCVKRDGYYFVDYCELAEGDRSKITIAAHLAKPLRLIVIVQTSPSSKLRGEGMAVIDKFMKSVGLSAENVSLCLINGPSGTGVTFQQQQLFVRCDSTGDYSAYTGQEVSISARMTFDTRVSELPGLHVATEQNYRDRGHCRYAFPAESRVGRRKEKR